MSMRGEIWTVVYKYSEDYFTKTNQMISILSQKCRGARVNVKWRFWQRFCSKTTNTWIYSVRQKPTVNSVHFLSLSLASYCDWCLRKCQTNRFGRHLGRREEATSRQHTWFGNSSLSLRFYLFIHLLTPHPFRGEGVQGAGANPSSRIDTQHTHTVQRRPFTLFIPDEFQFTLILICVIKGNERRL